MPAQYAAGFDFGAPVPGIARKTASVRTSRTETYVALQAFIDNWRWAGVPFFLRTGKRLPKRASEISIQLKEVPPILFNRIRSAPLDPNVLTIRIQPDEGFAFGISSKVPGPQVRIYPVQMDFRYGSTFGASTPEAYERLLLDVMAGDPSLFMRRDAVEAAWRWVMPILESLGGRPDEADADLSRRRLGPGRSRPADRVDGATMAVAVAGRTIGGRPSRRGLTPTSRRSGSDLARDAPVARAALSNLVVFCHRPGDAPVDFRAAARGARRGGRRSPPVPDHRAHPRSRSAPRRTRRLPRASAC